MADELRRRRPLPMPKVYICPHDAPNAFATGRSPRKAAVAVTQGLLQVLDRDELAGVIAHEPPTSRTATPSPARRNTRRRPCLHRPVGHVGGGQNRGSNPLAMFSSSSSPPSELPHQVLPSAAHANTSLDAHAPRSSASHAAWDSRAQNRDSAKRILVSA
ncbi:MAG: M48 family metalloprotease [Phycisphaeraceae bacterium]|nr:M48 family metalloprotease [Phycisphaeraceae bacterium]